MVNAIPDSVNTVTPYLVVPNAIEAIDFYVKAFGAQKVIRMPGPGGKGTLHAQISLGNSSIMLTDENPQWEMVSAKTLGGSPVSMMVYVDKVDDVFNQAVSAGCEVKFPVTDMFWGDRMGKVVDPYGLDWSIATHIEDVADDEMATRQQAWFADMAKQRG